VWLSICDFIRRRGDVCVVAQQEGDDAKEFNAAQQCKVSWQKQPGVIWKDRRQTGI
jgi:hypothetical protein